MKYRLLIIAFALFFAACNDWLDIRPETEQKDEGQFSSVNGFFDALIGCYMTMADDDAYGQRLTMSNIESMANLWKMSSDHTLLADLELSRHEYGKDNARTAIADIYGKLFHVIAQANMIIKYADEKGQSVFADESMLKMVQGEAYAIRAYCQFDVLRLFGPVPGKGDKELPYSFTTSINEVPAYYAWDAYVGLLKADITKALELLQVGDPILGKSFDESFEVASDFQMYRQSRLNYWAVKGLEARMLLYIGDPTGAHTVARSIIDAKNAEGEPVRTMSIASDIAAGYGAFPNECLFYISKYDLLDKAITILVGGAATDATEATGTIQYRNDKLVISGDMFTDMYDNLPSTYNRKGTKCWGEIEDSYSRKYRTVMKYYWNADKISSSASLATSYQIIPLVRMSEIYLIAMETATDLVEINELYQAYMRERNVNAIDLVNFSSVSEVWAFVLDEYRREFYAEGHMFYTYKRRNETNIKWYDGTVNENTYVLPLPETEYNPNKF